ncbi:uncharacterized protein [Spinacia oleracea]|uniref:Uncharacterized protein isoform X5 n=1 Tax=Spinacia oleracea TaxID=3562 RepID=A0ABM3RKC2_SPIOL|nr:uncharacterized protein LOC110802225 isoform X5 [Spinacia oleracea]
MTKLKSSCKEKMSRFRNCGKFNLNEVAEFEVHSSSNSEQDDSEDRDFNADIVDDEDDDELLNPVSTTTMKQKRGRPKGSKNKQQAIVEKKVTKVKVTLETRVFEDNSFTKGGEVKEAGDVLKVLQEEYKGRMESCYSIMPLVVAETLLSADELKKDAKSEYFKGSLLLLQIWLVERA